MIIAKGKENTGNSVSDYYWEYIICDRCGGEGEIYIDTKEEFLETLKDLEFCSLFEMLYVMHRWKKEKMVRCPECNGEGEWEDRY